MKKLSYLLLIFNILLVTNSTFSQTQPNIVLIMADDLGYADLSCYGAENIQTPHLDALAAEGVRLTDFYANGPECTPTRTALLTGRYQQRVGGLECAIGLGNIGRYTEAKQLSDQGELGLPVTFNALPMMLNGQGYNTAIIGKWHLGEGEAYRPAVHGFDYSIGPLGGAVDYFHHTEPVGEFIGTYMEGNHDFYRNDAPHQRGGYYMTHLLTDEAVEWVNIQKEDQPFFLYLPYTTPHLPYQAPYDYQPEKLTMEHWNKSDKEVYAAMIEDMDAGIGKILDKLEEKGIADNTIVIFFSDNGPNKTGNTGPYSGNKGHVYEGGIRVPCIIRWPGKIEEGGISSQPFISMDLTASIAAITKATPPKPLDGIDLIGHITARKADFSRDLFWRKKRAAQVRSAVRSENLKYIREEDKGKFEEYLFDLKNDPGEKHDLKADRPEDFKRLKKLLAEWEEEVRPERKELQ